MARRRSSHQRSPDATPFDFKIVGKKCANPARRPKKFSPEGIFSDGRPPDFSRLHTKSQELIEFLTIDRTARRSPEKRQMAAFLMTFQSSDS
jgi:hypothetical protein